MNKSISEWLDSFEIGEVRFLPVNGQEEANNLVRQISAKSRRKKKTKSWRFVCSTYLALNVSDVDDQQTLVEVVAIGPETALRFTL